ncbi:hypothetical protein EPD83_020310 [Phycicoccus sp. CMS6Z-2]|uniref:Uncharacterized protein n=1 Tax=Phycicoccus flavus TaxID=2502783 RepID=A0A8T6R768_9MICO|nr:hypothetical protein [Phycicoccus flavus]
MRELGAVRRRHPWLATGTVSDVDVSGDLLRYRVSSGDQVLEVRVNRGPEPGGGAVPVPAHGWVVSPPAP